MPQHVKIPAFDEAVTYTVGGTPQDTFAVPFPFFAASDVLVRIDGEALSPSVYTVTGLFVQGEEEDAVEGAFGSGQVTLDAEVANVEVTIDRMVEAIREDDFSSSAPMSPRQINTAFDKLTARDQDLRREFNTGVGGAIAAAATAVAATAGKADVDLGNVSSPSVISTIGVSRGRGFVADADNTDALVAVLEGDAGEWKIPPSEPGEAFLINELPPAFDLSNKRIDALGARFSMAGTLDPEADAAFITVAEGTTDFQIVGGTYDFDGANIADLADDLAATPWAAVRVLGAERGLIQVKGLNIPGYAVRGEGMTDVDVTIATENCFSAGVFDEVSGGVWRINAIDSDNRFNGQVVNANGDVFQINESEEIELYLRVNGVKGKYNPTKSQFYAAFTYRNLKRSRIIAPLVTGMVHDEALDADCMQYLAMSLVGQDCDIISPRVETGCDLAIEFMATEGGNTISNYYINQGYQKSRVTSKAQGFVVKSGGFMDPPNTGGRISTPGRPSLINGGVVLGCPGVAHRWRSSGYMLAGSCIAVGATHEGHAFDHLDKTSSDFGAGYVSRAGRDQMLDHIVSINCGKGGIAVNSGERLNFGPNCQSYGNGWNATKREEAVGIGHSERTDSDSDAGSVSLSILGGDYAGPVNTTIANAISFAAGPGEEIVTGTPWTLPQKAIRFTDMQMGQLGKMFRIRDVMGAGIDALCRVIHQDGDGGVVVYEAVQELSGTHSFNSGTRALTGSSSSYTTELVVGQKVYLLNGVYGVIEEITNDTSAKLASAPAMTGTFSNKIMERVLDDPPDWTTTGFTQTLTGTVSINEGATTLTGSGTDFDGDLKGPCYIIAGSNTLVARGVTSDTTLRVLAPGGTATVSAVTGYMVLAQAETFNPQHHSIRFDDDYLTELFLNGPRVGNAITQLVSVSYSKISGPSRFIMQGSWDYAASNQTNVDLLTGIPAGWALKGISARAEKAISGPTGSPTGINIQAVDTSNTLIGGVVCALPYTTGVIAAGVTARGAFNLATPMTAEWKVRATRNGGSGSQTAGLIVVNADVAFDAPAYPNSRVNQL
jgi:hypothetical protein